MSSSKELEVSAASSDIVINHDVATESRQKASSKVARANVAHLRDDPEAKVAFLSAFTADDERRIMRKVDKIFFLLTGTMYLIKQASLIIPGVVEMY